MKVFNGVRKSTDKAIEALTKVFGFSGDIYYPLEFKSKQHGFRDEDVTYRDEPEETTVLIPALFRDSNATLSKLDPFTEEGDRIMYAPSYINYPKYSKVIVRYDGKTSNWIINEVLVKKDDDLDTIIFRRYVLVPSVSHDVERAREELVDTLLEQLETPEEPEELNPSQNLTNEVPPTKSSEIEITPIKRG